MIYSIWLVNQWKCAMLGKPKQRDFFQLGSTARLPRLPGRATRISFQDVPGFCVINYTNIGIDPKQSQQETKGKRLALACINMKKKLHAHRLLVSVYMQTKMQRRTRELFTAVLWLLLFENSSNPSGIQT